MKTVFFNGMPMHLSGELPVAGEQAPYFVLCAKDLSDINLNDYKGKRVVLNIFPSIDTDVCATSVRKFNEMASKLPDTVVLCVSKDLPFAAARFCVANGIENVAPASAFRSDFGDSYGLTITDGPLRGLLARAVIVIGKDGEVLGTSLCEQITEEPDYESVKTILEK